MMKFVYTLLFIGVLGILSTSCEAPQKDILLLLPGDPLHEHYQWALQFSEDFQALPSNANINIVTSEIESDPNLDLYSTVMLVGLLIEDFDAGQKAKLERLVQAGGEIIGVNAISKNNRSWLWYGALTGAELDKDTKITEGTFETINAKHPLAQGTEAGSSIDGNWPKVNFPGAVEPIVQISEAGMPIIWQNEYDGGTTLQVVLAKDKAFSESTRYTQLLTNIGAWIYNRNLTLDYNKARTLEIPAENRFVQTVLMDNLDEPMELAVLPDGKVLFIERKGDIYEYDPVTNQVDSITNFPVHTAFEDGLMGITADPNYEENHWIYMYYAPVGSIPKQHLSRFVYQDKKLDRASEKVVLVVDTQRDECCHSGGSLAFGPNGNLFISTGDDTNPFASDGFSPIDERPGRSAWDAQRSSGNTNDLRGKILRIHPEPDGTYTIPDGNLFPEGTANTRPEIFVMGCRNPFRISIDQKNGYLYWGDVGPDAGKTVTERGPKGYDEINQAKQPGYWGWPFSRGNNIVYRDYNFATEQNGPPFDPENLINDSPNNTGLEQLPPAQKSLIWYSYDHSDEFPWVGIGGKNPMAGPVYYEDQYKESTRFPSYFDGKLIIYEWMRHWIYVVTLDEEDQFVRADPFMPNTTFSRPMDMAFDHNGKLYLLEYGDKWFARNPEARLSVIEYNGGNRPPIAKINVEAPYGAVPYEAKLSAAQSLDYDNDPMTYQWSVNGTPSSTTGPEFEEIFEEPGEYQVEVLVSDPYGTTSKASTTLSIGNAPPTVVWELEGNQSFFWPGRKINYQVKVADQEDGNDLNQENLKVAFDYLAIGEDMTEIAQGHAALMGKARIAQGKLLVEGSDCKVCHGINEKINGPSYLEIADRYKGQDVSDMLAKKIINGGNGNWGETVMSAHPDLTEQQAGAMVAYILSVEENADEKVYPQEGRFVTEDADETGRYFLWASYTDNGSEKAKPITIEEQITLRHPKIQAEFVDILSKGLYPDNFSKERVLKGWRHNTFIGVKNIDLTEVSQIQMRCRVLNAEVGAEFVLFAGEIGGAELGRVKIDRSGGEVWTTVTFDVGEINQTQDLYLVCQSPEDRRSEILYLDYLFFDLGQGLAL